MKVTTNNKMSWFIEQYNNGTLPYHIQKSGMDMGTICMPTGTGKSGVVYEDIVYRIDHITGKIIINISTPILKLNQQFVKDLFEVLKEIYRGKENKFIFFINSSDSGISYNEYVKDMEVSVNKFKPDIFERRFINSSTADVAIVISCHKSIHKFISYISKYHNILTGIDIVNYIDESHLITLKKHEDNTNELATTVVNINLLCKYSTCVYMLSATPDASVTYAVNAWNKYGKLSAQYLYKLSPIDAINDGIILSPYMHYIQTESDGINPEILISIMKDACKRNNNIKHKILVTLNSAEELKAMRMVLENDYEYKVFSTCSKYGFGLDDSIIDEGKITEFIKNIETYDDNCFVLHIRQMVQGIDIKSLTECVVWIGSNYNVKSCRHLIQIIGRTLRTPERDIPKAHRTKKFGGVYIITPKDNDKIKNDIGSVIVRYYGTNNILFDEKKYRYPGTASDDLWSNDFDGLSKSGNEHVGIDTLYINMKKEVEQIYNSVKIQQDILGIKVDLSDIIEHIAQKFSVYDTDCDTFMLLYDNSDMVKEIENTFKSFMY